MKDVAMDFLKSMLFSAAAVISVAVLVRFFSFSGPQAVILVAVAAGWWASDRKLRKIKEDSDYLHVAVDGLVLPRLRRLERRQRNLDVPEPSEEKDGTTEDYDDWERFCRVPLE